MTHEAYIREVPGSPQAVVLIHGILGTPRHFDFLIPLIPADYSIYNIQLDGHGGCVQDFSRTSMKKWQAQVSSLLDDILPRHDQVILVAHSMGTLFSIREAIARPKKFRHLFLLQIPLRPWLKIRTAYDALLLPFGIIPDRAQAMYNDCGLTLSRKLWLYLGWVPRFLELFALCYQTKKIMGQLTVPCQAFQSKKDELVSINTCRDIEKHPHYQMTILPNSGHFAYFDNDLSLIKSEFSKLFK